MNIKKLITTGIMAMAAMCAIAEPVVTDVVAKQRFPWNGLVDITCQVSGINGTTNGLNFAVAAVMPDSGEIRNVLKFWVVRNGVNSTDKKVATNGSYKLLWDAQADLGAVVHSNMVMRVNVVVHEKIQLWEGGPYWADTNIGAENPENSGYYFWWGDTVGYKCENDKWVASDGSSSNFSFGSSNTPTYNKSIATLKSEGWITADGALAPEHDAARVQWGGNWRMPTKAEFNALINNCIWTLTTINAVKGYIVSGTGDYASSRIFIPFTGYSPGTLKETTTLGDYWSSVPSSSYSNTAWSLFVDSSNCNTSDNRSYVNGRQSGLPIRPVIGADQ